MSDDRSLIEAHLPEHATVEDVEHVVAESQTLLEVQRELRIPRHHARPLVSALGLEDDLPGSAFLTTGWASDSASIDDVGGGESNGDGDGDDDTDG